MNRREKIAAHMMAAEYIIFGQKHTGQPNFIAMAALAIKAADELIRQLDESSGPVDD